jgi:hypothetical protein
VQALACTWLKRPPGRAEVILMQLTGELLQQIMKALRPDLSDRRERDPRTAPRVGIRSTVTIVPQHHTDPRAPGLKVWVRDVSVSGIGVLLSTQLLPGSSFTASFPRKSGPPIVAIYTVQYCKCISKDLYSIGGKLERLMPVPGEAPEEKPLQSGFSPLVW